MRHWICVFIAAVVLLSGAGDQLFGQRPNIILINLDDADAELLYRQMGNSNYPHMRQLAQNGVRFTNTHATTPFCAPSRASLMRGQYAFNSGIKVNDTTNLGSNGFTGGYGEFLDRQYDQNELGVWMQNAGYRTMHVGKYHHHGFDGIKPPGWDDFRSTAGALYFNAYEFTDRDEPNGQWQRTGEDAYVIDVNAQDSVDLINQQSNSDQPFFLYVAPLAPHAAQSGQPQDMVDDSNYNTFAPNQFLPVTPDFDEADISDKPFHLQVGRIPNAWFGYVQEEYQTRIRATKSVDDLIGNVMNALQQNNMQDNTYVMLTSDNGYLLGHHRLHAKTDPYQRTTNVPLIVSGPGVAKNVNADHLLAHIDICPTILELASAPIPASVDAKSFAPLLAQPNMVPAESWQDMVMIENWSDKNVFGSRIEGAYAAIRKHHEVFVSWANGTFEYYDLDADPFQLENSYRQLPVAQKQQLKNQVRRFRTRRAEPITTVKNQYRNFTQSQRVFLEGYTDDDVGTAGTFVAVKSFATGKFWNGEQWQTDWFGHFVPPLNPNQPISKWRFRTELTTETPSGMDHLVFTFRSLDSQGNYASNSSYLVSRIDGRPPEAAFDEFLDQSTRPRSLTLTGSAFDSVEFGEARLSIRQVATGRHFNGNGFQDNWTFVRPFVNQAGTRWNYSTTLPPGNYIAGVRGVDQRGNVQQQPDVIRFTVE